MKRTKVKALLLSISLAAAMSAPSAAGLVAHAASANPVVGVSGEQTDAAAAQTVTVSGLKKDSTVKLYQIVDGYYKDGKLVKYVLMDPVNGKIAAIDTVDENGKHSGPDSTKGQTSDNDIITENEITTIANNIQTGAFTADAGVDMTVDMTADANGYVSATADVEPGMYLVLATDPYGETVYNPAVVAVNITDANLDKTTGGPQGGTVNMTQFFTYKDGNSENAKNVYLKSSESKNNADKKMTGTYKAKVQAEEEALTGKTGEGQTVKDGEGHGDTIAIGDTVHFRIDGIKIPSYSADYTAPSYTITDTIDDSFDKIDRSNLKVYVGTTVDKLTDDKLVAAGTNTYTVKDNDKSESGFVINFATDYIKGLRGKTDADRAVIVTYDATLNSKANLNFAENHNRATIEYSDDPTNSAKKQTVNKDTYDYTFGIGASLDGGNTGITPNFKKVKTETNKEGKHQALEGAIFTLYSADPTNTNKGFKADEHIAKTINQPNGTATSDENGNISFTGLDEGTYYLQETVAPKGYTLSDKTYKFVIAAELNSDGTLKDYTITTTYKDATHPGWTVPEGEEKGVAKYSSAQNDINKDTGAVEPTSISRIDTTTEIVDTKLQTLPSTGGTGIVLIVGVAAALGVAGVALSKKGKQQ